MGWGKTVWRALASNLGRRGNQVPSVRSVGKSQRGLGGLQVSQGWHHGLHVVNSQVEALLQGC